MRVLSWNVNGLRSCYRKGFTQWLEATGAAVVGLQEVRARAEQLPEALREPDNWAAHYCSAEKPGYSGVGLLSRTAPDALETTLGEARFDREGRVQLARFGRLHVVNVYFPNGNGPNRDLSRIPYKLDFYARLFDELAPLARRGERILVMGDFNTAHREIDLARPKQNRETSGFRPEEREALDAWMRSGWVDTFRAFESRGGFYSWWSQRKGVRERNVGWRIDYVLASPAAANFLRSACVLTDVWGSDHCPVGVELDPDIVG